MSAEDDSRVALAEIKGDVKLILAGQDRTNNDIRDLRTVIHSHGDRLGILEADRNRRDGENTGKIRTGEVIWRVISFVGGSGGVLALMELLK